MKATIIGAGRLGAALALRSVRLGHETRVLCRNSDSPSVHPLPAEIRVEEIHAAQPEDAELVLIAAPGFSDPLKEQLVGNFLKLTAPLTTICSAVAYPGAPHEVWGANRSYLRFMCSPAISSVDQEPIVLILNGNRTTQSSFLEWLGPVMALVVQADAFERLSHLFMASVVHLETCRQFLVGVEGGSTAMEQKFMASTLREAAILLDSFGYSPTGALDACSTPHGATRDAVSAFQDAAHNAASAVLKSR